jgi:carboxypeptidase A2
LVITMLHIRNVVFLVCLTAVVFAYDKSYDGYQLLEVDAKSQHDHDAVTFLQQLDVELDFWYLGTESVQVFVAPEKLEDLKFYLESNRLQYRVINDHVQRDIEDEEIDLFLTRKASSKAFNFDDFNTFEDIVAELNNMAGRCRTDLGVNCEVYSIGQTYEGRDLFVLRIWRAGTSRKAVWIDATTHAREWLGTATHLKITTHLIDDYPTDTKVQYLIDTYDWYLLPVVNPDGYSYSWSSDRLWRKNRSPNDGSVCNGTDLNRNYNVDWANAGSSALPCGETYQGSSPASEFEVQAMQGEADRLASSLLTSIHIHTYAQYWLIPWGSLNPDGITCKFAVDHVQMMAVANPAADAVQNTFGTVWERGNSCQIMYPASGMAVDYFKAAGVMYTTTTELRGNSFIASPAQIQPSFEELWNGITTAISTIEIQP